MILLLRISPSPTVNAFDENFGLEIEMVIDSNSNENSNKRHHEVDENNKWITINKNKPISPCSNDEPKIKKDGFYKENIKIGTSC